MTGVLSERLAKGLPKRLSKVLPDVFPAGSSCV